MSVTAKRTIIVFFLAAAAWIAPIDLASQVQTQRVGYNFTFPYFEGDSQRPSSLVLGKKTKPQNDGRLLIEGLKIISFEYDEKNAVTTNMVIEAPTCLLDLQKRIASSTNKLTARVPDGSFSVHGVGFEFRQVDSLLQISNQVTRLKRPNLNLKTSSNEN